MSPFLLLALLAACAPDVCADPSSTATPAVGDANADGAVDISDALYVERWLYAGGASPACSTAADVIADGTVDVSDGVALLHHLYAGTFALPALADGACADVAPPSNDGECGSLTLGFDTPGRATGDFDATVQLTAPDLEAEGWQLSVTAEGCSITEASLAGTIAAPTTDGGLRQTGYAQAELSAGGAVSGVALGWLEQAGAPVSSDPRALLKLRVHASPPGFGCTPCVLQLVDGQRGSGAALDNVVSHGGRSYRPTLKEGRVDICAG